MKRNSFFTIITTIGILIITGCNQTSGASSPETSNGGSSVQNVLESNASPSSSVTPSAPSTPVERNYKTDALLYAGSGSWGAEVGSLENIMDQNHMTYKAVSSAELDAMSVDELAQYGLIIWPGGYGGTATGSLSAKTHANLREAVQKKGVSYVGFCAGSFVAVAPTPAAGKDVSYGLGIVDGSVLDYYYLENQGVEADMTLATFADGSKRDILWYGGPVTPNKAGEVVAKYPNGDAMISEMWSGSGFVVLSATHPTAPQSVKAGFGLTDSDGNDYELTYKLLQAALHQQPLPTF